MVLEKFYRLSMVPKLITFREFTVLWYVAHEKLNKEIADKLGISETRVDAIIKQLCRKLNVHGIKTAIRVACFLGILNKENC